MLLGFWIGQREGDSLRTSKNLGFSDLRETTVRRLYLGGASHAEVRSITGHKESKIASILESNSISEKGLPARAAITRRQDKG